MDWPTFFVQTMRSWMSSQCNQHFCPDPVTIQQLCPEPDVLLEAEIPRQITVNIAYTYLKLVNHPVTVFASTPGLSMHPLTLLLILVITSTLVSILSCCFVGHHIHSKRYKAICQIAVGNDVDFKDYRQESGQTMADVVQHSRTSIETKLNQTEADKVSFQHKTARQLETVRSLLRKCRNEKQKLLLDDLESGRSVRDVVSYYDRRVSDLSDENLSLGDRIRQFESLGEKTKTIQVSILAELETSNNEREELRTTISHMKIEYERSKSEQATAQAQLRDKLVAKEEKNKVLNFENEHLIDEVKKLNTSCKARSRDITAKDVEIVHLKARSRVITVKDEEITRLKTKNRQLMEEKNQHVSLHRKTVAKEQSLQAQISLTQDNLRDARSAAACAEDRCSGLAGQLASVEEQLLQQAADLTTKQAELADAQLESRTLSTQLQTERDSAQTTRLSSSTSEFMAKQVAEALNINYSHAEIIAIPNKKSMTSKMRCQRGRLVERNFKGGANEFKSTNGNKGHAHSIGFGETRLQVATNLKGTSKHHLKSEEKEIITLRETQTQLCERLPYLQEITKAWEDQTPAYTSIMLQDIIEEPTSTLKSLDLAIPKSSKTDISFSADKASAIHLWSSKTQYELSTLLSYRLRAVELEAKEKYEGCLASVRATYDLRLNNIITRLEKHNHSVRDSKISNIINDSNGLRSLVSKREK